MKVSKITYMWSEKRMLLAKTGLLMIFTIKFIKYYAVTR